LNYLSPNPFTVGEDTSEAEADKVFDMEGKIIAPGLIDIHCHPAAGFSWLGAPADEIGLNSGVTLLCDGGSSGAANFESLRLFIVEPAKTDILCFLNLSNTGLVTLPQIWCDQNRPHFVVKKDTLSLHQTHIHYPFP